MAVTHDPSEVRDSRLRKALSNTPLHEKDGFSSLFLMVSVSRDWFPGGSRRGDSAEEGRSPPVHTHEEVAAGVKTNPSYLPGYSWVQIALELLNVCMGRILHLESFLQEAQK